MLDLYKKILSALPKAKSGQDFKRISNNYARSTLLERKQEVQTYNLFGVPFTLHLTDLMFDFHILFVFL